jgi:hypothetical protein
VDNLELSSDGCGKDFTTKGTRNTKNELLMNFNVTSGGGITDLVFTTPRAENASHLPQSYQPAVLEFRELAIDWQWC